MKKAFTAGTILGALLLATTVSFAAGPITERQHVQERRINQGMRSGTISREELRHLRHDQRRIQTAKREAWSDGRLNRHELVRIERMQDRAGRKIHGAKTNDHYAHGRNHPCKPVQYQVRSRRLPVGPPCPPPTVTSRSGGFLGVAVAQPGWSLALSTTLD